MVDKELSPTSLAGRRLGRYQVLAQLAVGGMASVHIARALGVAGFERLFAIKVLHPHIAHDRKFIAMLLDEARLAARIHHTNVVSTIDISEAPETGYYLVMDYVEGDHLGALMREASRSGERLPWEDSLRILVDALGGLAAAHELTDEAGHRLNLVHRDISPPNILVGTDGISQLTDFGVAKAELRLTTTRKGEFKGKLCYMAPEQASGEHADHRSDLFAMGIILWECITGRRLFRGENRAATLNMVCRGPIPLPSSVDVELERFDPVVGKALHRDADQRFQSAVEFIEAIEEAAQSIGGLGSRRTVEKLVKKYAFEKIRREQELIRNAIAALGVTPAPVALPDAVPSPICAPDPGPTAVAGLGAVPPPPAAPDAKSSAGAPSEGNRFDITEDKRSKVAWTLGGVGLGIAISMAVAIPSLYSVNNGLRRAYAFRAPVALQGDAAAQRPALRSVSSARTGAGGAVSTAGSAATGAAFGSGEPGADHLPNGSHSLHALFEQQGSNGQHLDKGVDEAMGFCLHAKAEELTPIDQSRGRTQRSGSSSSAAWPAGQASAVDHLVDNPYRSSSQRKRRGRGSSNAAGPLRQASAVDELPDNPFESSKPRNRRGRARSSAARSWGQAPAVDELPENPFEPSKQRQRRGRGRSSDTGPPPDRSALDELPENPF